MNDESIPAVRQWIAEWSDRLGIQRLVKTRRIPYWHVTGPEGRPGCSLVGIALDETEPCIYHTRRLNEGDIVHELLHLANPEWTEDQVNSHTEWLLRSTGARVHPAPRGHALTDGAELA
ncbi:MAG: hypothetical protein FJX72_05980 [Armatimonadetes bacterium]|nr:hypothetical protein [Armatimonadota bacterium]